jgi:predicted enzyme related to lactoylglutathione lyase
VANSFVHLELNTTDVSKASTFYSQLFAWELAPMPGMDYTLIKTGGDIGGGIMKHPMPGAPSVWIPYISVDDLAASTKKAVALGGQLIKDITEVPGMGSFTIILDPTGGCVGLWKTV